MKRRDFLTGAVLAFAPRALADAVGDKLAAISRARAGAKSLVGPFTQVSSVGLLRARVQSTGTLYLQYPNRLRWELAAPDSVVYWVTPEGIAYRGQHGSGRLPANTGPQADLDALRAVLGGDMTILRTRFDVVLVPSDTAGPAFECTPKAGQPMKLRKVTFSLDPDLVRPHKSTLVYDDRNQSEITFGDLKRDVPIDPALLQLP